MTALPAAPAQTAFLPLQALDPAPKLTAALVFAVLVSCLHGAAASALACLVPLAVALSGGLPFGALARRLLAVNLFFLFLWVFLPLSLDADAADAVFLAGPLVWRRSGFALALAITLKGNAIACAILALAASSSVNACGRALLRLGLPAKLVTLMLLTHANIRLMRRESKRLHEAAKLRGFAVTASLRAWRTAAYLAAMLLLRAWERAERVGLAMRLRGFNGTFPLLAADEHAPETRAKGMALAAFVCVMATVLLVADRVFF